MIDHFVNRLSGGKTVMTHNDGTLSIFGADGQPDRSNLTGPERNELQQLQRQTSYQAHHDIATERAGDPRYSDIRDEIYRRGTPEEIVRADADPVYFNAVFENLHPQVGQSLEELDSDIARSDEVSGITSRLADRAEKDLSQPLEDIARLLDLTGRGGKEG